MGTPTLISLSPHLQIVQVPAQRPRCYQLTVLRYYALHMHSMQPELIFRCPYYKAHAPFSHHANLKYSKKNVNSLNDLCTKQSYCCLFSRCYVNRTCLIKFRTCLIKCRITVRQWRTWTKLQQLVSKSLVQVQECDIYLFASVMYMLYSHSAFDGCPFETDLTWLIVWPNTPRSTTSTQSCPGGLESMGTYRKISAMSCVGANKSAESNQLPGDIQKKLGHE